MTLVVQYYSHSIFLCARFLFSCWCEFVLSVCSRVLHFSQWVDCVFALCSRWLTVYPSNISIYPSNISNTQSLKRIISKPLCINQKWVLGSYSPAGAISCSLCAAGNYIPVSGSTACLLCAAGSYKSTSGASVCSPCAAGR